MQRLLGILFWSVIAAAFIGPGTVTTCALAGLRHDLALGWALTFSTVACFVLQEGVARLAIVSRDGLGSAVRRTLGEQPWAAWLVVVVGASVIFGCAAYQAGNILGAVAGAGLELPWPREVLAVAVAAVAATLLWFGRPGAVATALSVFVAIMGFAFVWVAVALRPPLVPLATGVLVPVLPPGSGLLVLGLVGTTVVPYNLFLGSGLARGQDLPTARLGLAVAIGLGGLISLAILVAGTALSGEFSYAGLAEVLAGRVGSWGHLLLAAGLFAAGASSAITAPLAAAMTASSVFGREPEPWPATSWRFRAVWLVVLGFGLAVGLSGVEAVAVIVAAQAANGLVLPLVVVLLLLATNDRTILGEAVNRPLGNVAMGAVAVVSVALGGLQLARAAARVGGFAVPDARWIVGLAVVVALVLLWPVVGAVRRRRG